MYINETLKLNRIFDEKMLTLTKPDIPANLTLMDTTTSVFSAGPGGLQETKS